MRVRPKRYPKRPRQSKVGELEIAITVNEKILRLEITVKNAMSVTVVEAFDELICEALK